MNNMQQNIDKKDRLLLYFLDINGRTSLTQLAKKTRMSKQRVKYRIERLESNGLIKGYSTMIDHTRLGFTTFRVYLKLKNVNKEKRQEIISYCNQQPQIWAVVLISGHSDIALGIGVQNIYQFYDIWEKLLSNYLELIKDYKISVYSPIYHFTAAYLVDKKDESKIRILGGQEKADYDSKDTAILLALSKNARTPIIAIAKHANLTAEATSYRIKQLEKRGIIQGYRAIIDVTLLGYQYYKAEIRLTKYDKISKILHFCHQHPNIYQVDKTIGGETLEIEFQVTSLQHMLNIIEELERTFSNIIESYTYFTVLSQEKHTYMPEIY
jgi:DNA-binding Lrp family transcriptional regulator